MNSSKYSVDEVCQRFGVTARTLHYYEEIGLIRDVPRTDGGHRYYDDRILGELDKIMRLKELMGISLQEIGALLELEKAMESLRETYRQAGTPPREKLSLLKQADEVLEEQIERVNSRIGKLEQLRTGFEQRLAKVRELQSQHASKNR